HKDIIELDSPFKTWRTSGEALFYALVNLRWYREGGTKMYRFHFTTRQAINIDGL
ncbi:hypothetical protein BgiMline_015673, partial [Biomphalaria glabrata]